MATLAVNISPRIFLNLQIRLISIPRAKKTTTMLSLKGRDYNTDSVPLRYIPKKYPSKNDELENSSPMKGFTKRVCDKRLDGVGRTSDLRNKANSQKHIYGESSFLSDARQDYVLVEEPNELAEEMEIRKENDILKPSMRTGEAMQDATKFAVDLLATRAFTAVELRKKLLGKRFSPDIAESVITNFQHRGLINDGLYAETFSRSRFRSSSWGPRRIMQALSKKGVSEADIQKALRLVFKEGEYGDDESRHCLSKLSMDHLLSQASKQWVRSQDAPKETRKSRIVRWLQYRGFNWNVISFVLTKLECQQK